MNQFTRKTTLILAIQLLIMLSLSSQSIGLSVTPSNQTIELNSAGTFNIGVTASNFNQQIIVQIASSTFPTSGVTTTIGQGVISYPYNSQATLQVRVGNTVPVGNYQIILRAGNGNTMGLDTCEINVVNNQCQFEIKTPVQFCPMGPIVSDYADNIWGYSNGAWVKYNTSTETLVSYPIPSNINMQGVKDFVVDRRGVLWLGAANGLFRFNQNLNWEHFNTSNSFIPTNNIIDLAYDARNDTMWMVGGGGIFKYDGTFWHNLDLTDPSAPSSVEKSCTFDRLGNMWVVTSDEKLLKRNQNGTTRYDFSALRYGTTPNKIYADSTDNIFILGTGMVTFNGSTFSHLLEQPLTINFCVIDTSSNILFEGNRPYNIYTSGVSLFVDNQNYKWLVTEERFSYPRRSVSKFNANEWKTYTTSNSNIPSDGAYCVAKGANNSLWFTLNTNNIFGTNYDILAKLNCDPNTISIEEQRQSENQAAVLPNPNNGTFNITFSQQYGRPDAISIFNIMGQKVYSLESITEDSQMELSLPEINNGVYLLVAHHGSAVETTKFIVSE